MAKPQNSNTPFIRQCVSLWIAENRHIAEFSVPIIAGELHANYVVFENDYDTVSKGVSNALQALETKGFLNKRKGTSQDNPHPYGWGRPPTIYSRKM